MRYAVVSNGSRQYKVAEGDVIEIDSLGLKAKESYVFPQVLLFVDEGKVLVGKPAIAGVSVEATVLEQKKGPKIRVAKFKAKARYRKVIGFRHTLSKIKIEKIAQKKAA